MRHNSGAGTEGRGRTQSFSNFRNNADGSIKTAKVSNWGRTSQEMPRPQRQPENKQSADIPQPKIWNSNSGITSQVRNILYSTVPAYELQLTPAGKVTNKLSAFTSLKMTERSEAKSVKRQNMFDLRSLARSCV